MTKDPQKPAGSPSTAPESGGGKQAAQPQTPAPASPAARPDERPKEIGGPSGPEPTRYGDWERNGRVSDF